MTTVGAVTPAAGQLSAAEARRMLRHPMNGIALLYLVVLSAAPFFSDSGPPANAAYGVVLLDFLLVYAPVTLVIVNRVAAATHRRRVREPLLSTPVDGRQRTVAAALALLRGPVTVSLIVALVLLVLGSFATSVTADPLVAVQHYTALEYLQLPALTLGAGLLGLAVARWLPWPGALPLAAFALLVQFMLLFRFTDSDVAPTTTWLALWPVWVAGSHGMLPPPPLHQEMWHLAYLTGLGVLAGVAALLRTDGPRRALWIAAAVTATVTVAAAGLQLIR